MARAAFSSLHPKYALKIAYFTIHALSLSTTYLKIKCKYDYGVSPVYMYYYNISITTSMIIPLFIFSRKPMTPLTRVNCFKLTSVQIWPSYRKLGGQNVMSFTMSLPFRLINLYPNFEFCRFDNPNSFISRILLKRIVQSYFILCKFKVTPWSMADSNPS